MLSQECNWEQQIENALEAVKFNQHQHNQNSSINGGGVAMADDPTTLIHRLQIKLKENLKQIEELENT